MNRVILKNFKLTSFFAQHVRANKFPFLNMSVDHLYSHDRALRKSFERLPIDTDNDNRLKQETGLKYVPPTRLRRYCELDVAVRDNECFVQSQFKDEYAFEQNVSDSRRCTRIFKSVEADILQHSFLADFTAQMCFLIQSLEPERQQFKVSVHQVRQICYPDFESHNSPKGIHRDGADYIVSALVMKRHNVVGGDSVIYSEDKRQVAMRETLMPAEFVFQEDRKLWHYVTPIQCRDPSMIGVRDIIGLDIMHA